MIVVLLITIGDLATLLTLGRPDKKEVERLLKNPANFTRYRRDGDIIYFYHGEISYISSSLKGIFFKYYIVWDRFNKHVPIWRFSKQTKFIDNLTNENI